MPSKTSNSLGNMATVMATVVAAAAVAIMEQQQLQLPLRTLLGFEGAESRQTYAM